MQETTPKEQIPTNKNKPEKHNSKKLSSQKFTIIIIMTMENKNKRVYKLTLKSAWPNLGNYKETALHGSSYPLLSSEQLCAFLSYL